MYFVEPASVDHAEQRAAVDADPREALMALADKLTGIEWDKTRIAAAVKDVLAEHRLKMGQFAPAVRVLVCGRPQTPSLDAVLELFARDTVLARLLSARQSQL
jgi:glutamyl-tRNA synthetase